ncbi:hypothetical protein FOXG_19664 [Fusarium oxysporum f. sp. lycopersici 4287]|uniref:Uncharacterized protein n=1 Tax=Fusarium oxysporum f. sp. lycopersici (strain 4287 / CBS 123668 / FGSC 9935 / NRRL 34936) TaxID=426428 RepID=A0A0J9V4G2_FUSO4|nr:hypothetical protein FOXG_19664 [Fusarium oxysporum f. sp. lycopersici 4287]KNB06414.1 hypothetical protein FOXG_19664 [Fusarium oxysporum f. sp. lycopersici 4287]
MAAMVIHQSALQSPSGAFHLNVLLSCLQRIGNRVYGFAFKLDVKSTEE